MSSGPTTTWYQRLRQRWVDRAAQRMYDRLVANPASYRSTPSTIASTTVAVLILTVAVVGVIALVWATLHASGFGWVLVVLGWAVVLVVRPRVPRLARDVVVLDPAEFPGLHGLVAHMARAVGVPVPHVVGVNLDFNAYVTSLGLRGRPAMVLGLPLMTLGSWPARLGVIGHELGHLRGRDTTQGRIVVAAQGVVAGVHDLIAPDDEDLYTDWDAAYELEGAGGFAAVLARGIQTVLASPFLLLSVILERLDLTSGQHREYLADKRSAEVVGTESVVEFLALDLEGVFTATAAAARRREDPFESLSGRAPASPTQRAARIASLAGTPHRADATHPPDHLRVALLEAHPQPPSPSAPSEVDCARAEEELARLRAAAGKEFRDELIHGPHS